MEEDSQPITEPIIPPLTTKDFDLFEKKVPNTNFDFDFMAGLMTKPELIRNVKYFNTDRHSWNTTSWKDILSRCICTRDS